MIFDLANFVIENQNAGTDREPIRAAKCLKASGAETDKPNRDSTRKGCEVSALNDLVLNCVFVVVHLRADVDQHEL